MKNIFKFMGIALMACSLTMVSCSKDEENSDNNGGNGNGGSTNTDPSVTVNFGGADQGTMGGIQALYASNYSIVIFDFFADANQSFPGVELYLASTASGETTSTYDDSNMSLDGGDLSICEFYEETALSNGQSQFGDWWAKTATSNVTSLDLTNMKASLNVNATMFWALQAFVEDYGAVGADNAETSSMTVAINNIALTNYAN